MDVSQKERPSIRRGWKSLCVCVSVWETKGEPSLNILKQQLRRRIQERNSFQNWREGFDPLQQRRSRVEVEDQPTARVSISGLQAPQRHYTWPARPIPNQDWSWPAAVPQHMYPVILPISEFSAHLARGRYYCFIVFLLFYFLNVLLVRGGRLLKKFQSEGYKQKEAKYFYLDFLLDILIIFV